MRHITVLALFVSITTTLVAQDKSTVLQSHLVSVDVGFIGGWITYEHQIGNKLTLNIQPGLDGGFAHGTNSHFKYHFTPTLTIEPRYYYNIQKRPEKQRKTINNSANYLTLSAWYIPGLFTVGNDDRVAIPSLHLIPKWGLRRTIGDRFIFEFAAGFGVELRQNSRASLGVGMDLQMSYVLFRS